MNNETQFQPANYGCWLEGEIVKAEERTSRAGHPMTHVQVRIDNGTIYDAYLSNSGYPPLRALVRSLKDVLGIAEHEPLPPAESLLGKKVAIMVFPWFKAGISRDGISVFGFPKQNEIPF
jgi:hypothetical protein